jgi:hypothetical protein
MPVTGTTGEAPQFEHLPVQSGSTSGPLRSGSGGDARRRSARFRFFVFFTPESRFMAPTIAPTAEQ